MNLRNIMTDAKLFGPIFGGPEWASWRAFATAVQGIAPNERGMGELIRQCLGDDTLTLPATYAREVWCIVGRRGGKSRMAALIAVFRACFCTYRLAAGERGVVMVIAADRRQARVVFRYILGLLTTVPMLAALIKRQTKSSIDLSNGISVEIQTASFRAIRGYTVVAAILDELAFWPQDDSANPDAEILNALRPAMATVPGALLVAISSPYARKGELWRAHKQYFGRSNTDRVLVWQAPTWVMNPTLPRDSPIITQAYADDEAVADAEYGANFRRDVESFIAREVVDSSIIDGRRELPPLPDLEYVAFVDPSGGSVDSFTIAVAHYDRDSHHSVLDAVRETKPPFSPEQVVADFATLLQSYRISTIRGDKYAGEWAREPFRKLGIEYDPSAKPKSDIYKSLLPLLNSGKVELLDHKRLVGQLATLERRTARGGRDSIDHQHGAHDDVVNSAAGALVLAATDGARAPLLFG